MILATVWRMDLPVTSEGQLGRGTAQVKDDMAPGIVEGESSPWKGSLQVLGLTGLRRAEELSLGPGENPCHTEVGGSGARVADFLELNLSYR